MNRIKPLITGLFLLLLTSFKSDKSLETFKTQLERSNMAFEMPMGFAEVKVIRNTKMNYDYAIKHSEKNFEVRFAIRPLGELLKTFNELEKTKKPGDINLSPNRFYKTSLQTTVLNISGGKMPQLTTFPPQAVNAEFNADWGATSIFEVEKEFGQTYKYCMIVAIHKDNLADAYYFYLADKQETIDELIEPVFHCLKFK